MNRARWAFTLAFTCVLIAHAMRSAQGEESLDQPHFEKKTEESNFALIVLPGFSSLSVNGKKLSGPDIGAQARLAVTDRIGFGFEVLQTLASSPLGSSLRTNIELSFTYGIFGSLKRYDSSGALASRTVVSSQGSGPEGLRVSIFLIESFLGVSGTSGSLTGVGGSLYYEFSGWGIWHPLAGIRLERIRNNANSISGTGGFLGLSIVP